MAPRPPIAVLGGGLAGAAACLRLAALGHRPLWIAPPVPPGDRPGETLAAAARPILAGLGAAELLDDPRHRAANATLSAWGQAALAERSGIVHLEGPGLVLDRPAFDAALAARAAALAERVTARVTACHPAPDGWHLETDGAGAAHASVAIDATGRAAILARDRAGRFRADRLAALCAFLPQDPASDVTPTAATLIETVAAGWWYASLLADGRLALAFYTDSDLLPKASDRDTAGFSGLIAETRHVARWIAEAGFRLDRPPVPASAATAWLAPAAGATWLAAGDAAAAFDPLSSHGMTTALWTGTRSAEAAHALAAGDPAPARRYAAEVARGVDAFLADRRRLYARERRFADAPFWARRAFEGQEIIGVK